MNVFGSMPLTSFLDPTSSTPHELFLKISGELSWPFDIMHGYVAHAAVQKQFLTGP